MTHCMLLFAFPCIIVPNQRHCVQNKILNILIARIDMSLGVENTNCTSLTIFQVNGDSCLGGSETPHS